MATLTLDTSMLSNYSRASLSKQLAIQGQPHQRGANVIHSCKVRRSSRVKSFYCSAPSVGRLMLVIFPTLVAALTLPLVAQAGFQHYVQNETLYPSEFRRSGYNGWEYNAASWNWYGSNGAVVQITLCHPDNTCYPYTGDDDGHIADFRSISYGRAKCQVKNDSPTAAEPMYDCYTDTGDGWEV
jgi:hypothetical protein